MIFIVSIFCFRYPKSKYKQNLATSFQKSRDSDLNADKNNPENTQYFSNRDPRSREINKCNGILKSDITASPLQLSDMKNHNHIIADSYQIINDYNENNEEIDTIESINQNNISSIKMRAKDTSVDPTSFQHLDHKSKKSTVDHNSNNYSGENENFKEINDKRRLNSKKVNNLKVSEVPMPRQPPNFPSLLSDNGSLHGRNLLKSLRDSLSETVQVSVNNGNVF